jgi:hypothetical protein
MNAVQDKLSLFIVRTLRNTQIQCVDKMKGLLVSNLQFAIMYVFRGNESNQKLLALHGVTLVIALFRWGFHLFHRLLN